MLSRAITVAVAAAMLTAGVLSADTEQRAWQTQDGRTLQGAYVSLADGMVQIQTPEGGGVSVALDELQADHKRYVLGVEGARGEAAPPPPWAEGYRVRYKLRVASDMVDLPAQTVTASIPTGGWLKPRPNDIVVQTREGKTAPAFVLSHDRMGDTIIQFRRSGYDPIYWVYASNPQAPDPDAAIEQSLGAAQQEAETATLAKMAAQKASGERAAELRDLADRVQRETQTLQGATAELAEWDKLLPERTAAAEEAVTKLRAAEQGARKAAEAHAPFGKVADEKTGVARGLSREAAAARSKAQQAEQAHEAARKRADEALAAAEQAEAEAKKAKEEAARVDARDEGKAAAEERAKKSAEAAAAARAAADEAARAAKEAGAARAGAEKLAQEREGLAAPAEEAAKQARLAAAPTAAALAEAERMLAEARGTAGRTAGLVTEARARIEHAQALKAAAENALADLNPKLEPVQQAAQAAQARAEQALAEARVKEQVYYDLAYEADPRLFKEGMTVEYRKWEGDKLGDWPVVVEGLRRSETVTDNAIVGAILQNEKLFRRATGRDFSASYRGYLRVDQPGVYSFCVNADDTSFLFINGYKVYSRTGTNAPLRGRAPLYSIGADIELEAGVHTLEVHDVVGNTLGATGYAKLLWLPPGAQAWSVVPDTSFTRSLLAVPVAIEAFDGGPVAVFAWGMDDALSADGVTLYLARFEALGPAEPDRIEWDFGDGTSARGRSVTHVFFREGDVEVSLKSHPALPPFRRRCHIETPPIPTGPHSLRKAVEVIGRMDLSRLDTARLNDACHYLRICGQEGRWPVMERVCGELLGRKGLDLAYRALLHTSLMQALARQGRGAEAVQVSERALEEVGRVRTLRALLMLETANLHRDVLRDFGAADKLYAQIVREGRRLRHPIVRQAAVAWGDMHMDAGDLARAGEAYRLAGLLGSIGGAAAQNDPVQRGALLRVAEQQLKQGDIRQTRRMLERIEADYPEEKLDGLYRFLRAEADRYAGQYESAIRHYEVLMQMGQWASYRPSALYGIADSYYRMGDFDKALEWLAALKDSYPEFFAQRVLGNVESVISARKQRASAAPGEATEETGSARARLFAEAVQDFEPPAESTSGQQPRLTMGFAGPNTLMLRDVAAPTRVRVAELKNLPSQGSLWVEFWYRTQLGLSAEGPHRYVTVEVYDEQGQRVAGDTLYAPRTFGQWRKAAYAFPAPVTPDGSVVLQAACAADLMEIDAVQVMHVSDGLNNALRRFIEGADPQ